MRQRLPVLSLLIASCLTLAQAQLAPNAPADRPVPVTEDTLSPLERAIAPYVAIAHATYPAAKQRYLAGLPPRHTFFITTRIRDASGKWEQVFIAVNGIKDGQISGTIASDLLLVKDYKRGDHYTFPETDLLDWLISKPDGTEEGNVVGNFLDTYRP
jgi:hypothetical protein